MGTNLIQCFQTFGDIAEIIFQYLCSYEVCYIIDYIFELKEEFLLKNETTIWNRLAWFHYRGYSIKNTSKRKCLINRGSYAFNQYYKINSLKHKFDQFIRVIRGNILDLKVINGLPIDGIAFSVPPTLKNSHRGVQRLIHRMAGPQLYYSLEEYLQSHGSLKVADVMVTSGYNSGAKYLFHAHGPSYHHRQKEEKLYRTYSNILSAAEARHLKNLAIVSISTGLSRIPLETASRVAMSCFRDYILENEPNSCFISMICLDLRTELRFLESKSNIMSGFLRQHSYA